MSLATILILNVAVAAILLALLWQTMRLPFRLHHSTESPRREHRRWRRERSQKRPVAGRRETAERPNLQEPVYSNK
jgi:hypothetical protein